MGAGILRSARRRWAARWSRRGKQQRRQRRRALCRDRRRGREWRHPVPRLDAGASDAPDDASRRSHGGERRSRWGRARQGRQRQAPFGGAGSRSPSFCPCFCLLSSSAPASSHQQRLRYHRPRGSPLPSHGRDLDDRDRPSQEAPEARGGGGAAGARCARGESRGGNAQLRSGCVPAVGGGRGEQRLRLVPGGGVSSRSAGSPSYSSFSSFSFSSFRFGWGSSSCCCPASAGALQAAARARAPPSAGGDSSGPQSRRAVPRRWPLQRRFFFFFFFFFLRFVRRSGGRLCRGSFVRDALGEAAGASRKAAASAAPTAAAAAAGAGGDGS